MPSGARLTIHTDGTFSYDTNHAFDSLNAGQTAAESFTYTVTGGATATMSFSIVGEGEAPDTIPPTVTINTIAGDDVVNAAEGAATITLSGLATGAEDGQLVTLALKTPDGSVTLNTMTAGERRRLAPRHSGRRSPAFPDGSYLVTANVSDAAGNPAPEATRISPSTRLRPPSPSTRLRATTWSTPPRAPPPSRCPASRPAQKTANSSPWR